jgi:hypothetical protein
MIRWIRARMANRSPMDEKYARAMILTNEVEQTMREKAASPDPIRALLADMFLQNHDVALVADAYEMMQESRIFKGPESE